ncbi:ankyrin repeat domain-containing protein [Nevskia ramosa]|uniref:ankyrin repeat domain-containing protein n=1 Tax=Nevskia ramosa TaxID=64002 RepID=UPI0003B52BA4|nr:ankyrin repeat domain-containing protein [Nevskia ramosa]
MILNKTAFPFALAASLLLSACAQQAAKPEAAAVAAVDPATTPPTLDTLEIAKLSAEDRIGLTVHFARIGDLDGLKRMLDAGADVNGRDTLDQTPLIAAVSQDSLPAVEAVLKRGASVDIVDKAGWSPLHFATFFSADTTVMKALLDAGANVNAQNDRGITSLYFAAATGHEAQVKFLLEHGADRSIASKAGWTPLRITKVKGIESVAKLLDPEGKGEAAPVSKADVPASKTTGGS